MTALSQTFTSDGTFTAPATLLTGAISFGVYGQPGAGVTGFANGGPGSSITGSLAIAPAGTLACYANDYHLGGTGGTGTSIGGGQGGGSSAIVQGGVLQAEAGGGGGGSRGFYGGYGGQPAQNGGGNSGVSGHAGGGTGANGSTPGSGGPNGGGGSGTAGAGSAGGSAGTQNGGNGAGGAYYGGGGGGGGYAGGGGGGDCGNPAGMYDWTPAGGGGGSSYMSGAVTGGTIYNGSVTSGGGVIINYRVADAPLAPTITSPANGSSLDSNAAGVTIDFTYNPGTDSGAINGYALTVKQDSGAIQYWNATTVALQSGIVWNTVSSGTSVVTIPSGKLADGHQYTITMANQESNYSLQGSFCSPILFYAVAQPTATLSVPISGQSLNSTTPTFSWTETLTTAAQTAYRYVVYTAAQAAVGGFVAGVSPSTYDSGPVSSASLNATVPGGYLLNGSSYVVYLQITETGGLTSAWVHNPFSIVFDGPMTPTLTATPSTDPLTSMPVTDLSWVQNDNLLSLIGSSFEGATGGSTIAATTNANYAVSTDYALDGVQSLKITAPSSGTRLLTSETITGIVANDYYRTVAFFTYGATARTVQVSLQWRNSSGTLLSTTAGTAVTEGPNAGAWIAATASGQAPTGATELSVLYTITGATAGTEAQYMDCCGVFAGPQGANLVPDSDVIMLGQGLETWGLSSSIEYGSAGFEFVGVGASTGFILAGSEQIWLGTTMGTHWELSAEIDLSGLESGAAGSAYITMSPAGGGSALATATCLPGQVGQFSVNWTQATYDAVIVEVCFLNLVVPEGVTVTIGQPQLVQASGVTAYTRGPTWTLGGMSGQVTEVQSSIDGINWSDVRNGSTITDVEVGGSGGGSLVDYEAPLNSITYYRARTSATSGGVTVTGLWSPSVPVTIPGSQWWLFDPTSPDSPVALGLHRAAYVSATVASGGQASLQVDKNETQAQFLVFGRSTYIVLHGDMHDEEFDIACVYLGNGEWAEFNAIRNLQKTVCLRSDMGDVYYGSLGPARPGIILRGDRMNPEGPYRQATFHVYPEDKP